VSKRKADCTPEEWAAYLARCRALHAANPEKRRAQQRSRHAADPSKRRLRDTVRHGADPEKARVKDKRRYAANRENIRVRQNAKRASNPERVRENSRVWYAANKKRVQEQARERVTGMAPWLIEALRRRQGGLCAICRGRLPEGRLTHADHCHDTKVPRGLLCSQCNLIEGLIKKRGLTPSEWGARAESYLENPPAQQILELIA
jgi:hypothetical protein